MCWNTAGSNTERQKLTGPKNMVREARRLQFEPQLALPVPHDAVVEGAGKPAGGRGPGDAGERPGVDADMRHLLLKGGQVAVVDKAEHVQVAQRGERLAQVAANMTQVPFWTSLSLSKRKKEVGTAAAGGTYVRAAR